MLLCSESVGEGAWLDRQQTDPSLNNLEEQSFNEIIQQTWAKAHIDLVQGGYEIQFLTVLLSIRYGSTQEG